MIISLRSNLDKFTFEDPQESSYDMKTINELQNFKENVWYSDWTRIKL